MAVDKSSQVLRKVLLQFFFQYNRSLQLYNFESKWSLSDVPLEQALKNTILFLMKLIFQKQTIESIQLDSYSFRRFAYKFAKMYNRCIRASVKSTSRFTLQPESKLANCGMWKATTTLRPRQAERIEGLTLENFELPRASRN